MLLGHARQTELIVAACSSENFPCAQSVQDAEPLRDLYVPIGHCSHSLPSVPVYPALQIQSISSSLLVGENVLDGHMLQLFDCAYSDEYVPGAQGKQGDEPGVTLKWPGLHSTHAVGGPV